MVLVVLVTMITHGVSSVGYSDHYYNYYVPNLCRNVNLNLVFNFIVAIIFDVQICK